MSNCDVPAYTKLTTADTDAENHKLTSFLSTSYHPLTPNNFPSQSHVHLGVLCRPSYLQSILDMLNFLLFIAHNKARAIVIIIENINSSRTPLARV